MANIKGMTIFPAFRPGNHNWLENNKRPFFNVVDNRGDTTQYADLFLNDRDIEVKETKTHVTIKIPKKTGIALGRYVVKD